MAALQLQPITNRLPAYAELAPEIDALELCPDCLAALVAFLFVGHFRTFFIALR